MMAIILDSIHQVDHDDNRHLGIVIHRESRIIVVVVGPIDRLTQAIGTEITAEYELTTIDSVEIDLPQDDEMSGIFGVELDQVIIDGRVHMIIEDDENFAYIDVYLMNGADFLALTTDDVPRRPKIHSRIQIRGRGLVVFPTFT